MHSHYYDKSTKAGRIMYPEESMGTSSKLDGCLYPDEMIGHQESPDETYPMAHLNYSVKPAQAGHTGESHSSHSSY